MTQNSDSIVDVQSGMPPPGERASRPSVFLSETSALILVVEIGFLRHRSRRRGTRWKEGGGGGKKWPGGKETDFGARSHMTSAEKNEPCTLIPLSPNCHILSFYVCISLPSLPRHRRRIFYHFLPDVPSFLLNFRHAYTRQHGFLV